MMEREELPPFVIDLLAAQGISSPEEREKFLHPKLADLPKPENMLNLFAGAERIVNYLEQQLQIVIWGDYDVDGTTSTALLVHFFRQLGRDVLWHIPNRLTDGYGINIKWFRENISRFQSKRFLLITVDNGISSKKEIAEIQQMGGEVIVTDHHSIPATGIPDCIVINPEQEGCGFHKEKIAGVGLAFYLTIALRSVLKKKGLFPKISDLNIKQFLAFVALGTVADMVHLTPTNRILVRGGMEELNAPKFVGISALLAAAGIESGGVSSEDIGFLLGPRINAAGRLGDSKIAVELLTADSPEVAKRKADSLNRINDQRKRQTEDDFELAQRQTSAYKTEQEKICIAYGDFHVGVAGIVASRLVDKYGVPAFVLAKVGTAGGKDIYTGSGRSIAGINLVAALEDSAELLQRYGGHAMAAGITIYQENIAKFTKKMGQFIGEVLTANAPEKRGVVKNQQIQFPCALDTVMSRKYLRYFTLLEPFGVENPQPLFYDDKAIVSSVKAVGNQNQHINVTFRGQNHNHKGIGFNMREYLDDIQEQHQRKLVYSLTKNRFRGTVSWQVQIHSI